MKHIFILSLFLIISSVVGSDTVDQLNKESSQSQRSKWIFSFKLSVNGNSVILNNNMAAVFHVRNCKKDMPLAQLRDLIIKNIEFSFALTDIMPNFSLFGREITDLTKCVYPQDKLPPISCIPTCAIETSAYPKKNVVGDKVLNWIAFSLSQSDDGKYKLFQKKHN